MADGGPGLPVLGAIFNAILGGVDGNIQVAFNYTAAWLNNLLHNLVGLFKWVRSFLSTIARALQHVWENYIKAAIKWLAEHAKKLYEWLHREATALVKWAKKIKQWYDQHILPFQLKQIALIQHIRQILGILKAFHIKWATTLDQKLGDLQSRIVGTIELIRGSLNSIINFANLIFDPTLLIRRTALGGSLLNMLGGLKRIAGFGSGLGLTKAQASNIDHWNNYYTEKNTLTYFQTVNQIGPTEEDRQLDLDARDALTSVTGVAQ
jgi:hypothetical protein